jgi:hypothetical protein
MSSDQRRLAENEGTPRMRVASSAPEQGLRDDRAARLERRIARLERRVGQLERARHADVVRRELDVVDSGS